MKSASVVFAAAVLASLSVTDAVDAAPRDKPKTDAAQGTQESYQDAWYTCQSWYAGARGYLAKDRYAYIEQCFKEKTGKYPGQVGMNCVLRRC
jgi:hypothetical protein